MKNTLRIGDAIYTILKEFKNVYPVKADEGTTFPFIIYRRVSGDNKSSKDGIYSSIAHITGQNDISMVNNDDILAELLHIAHLMTGKNNNPSLTDQLCNYIF